MRIKINNKKYPVRLTVCTHTNAMRTPRVQRSRSSGEAGNVGTDCDSYTGYVGFNYEMVESV